MANRIGYVVPEGKRGDKVADSVDIYATPSFKTVIRNGNKGTFGGSVKERYDSFQKAREDAENRIKSGQKSAAKKVTPLAPKSKDLLAINQDTLAYRVAKELYNESEAQYANSAIKKEISKQISTSFADETGETLEDPKGGFTQSGIGAKIKARWKSVDAWFAKQAKPVQKAADMQKAVGQAASATPAAVISKWFDEQEAIIDAIPSMSKIGKDIYEVEYRTDGDEPGWYYTGVHKPADRAANQRIQEIKANVCAYLTKKMSIVNDKINDMLTEQLNKLEKCKPFTVAMEVISSIPSLGTIIKWATAVIDFFVGTYILIFNIIKMAIQVMELIIVRGPQLINKIISKVTEFDCPVQFNIEVKTTKDK